MTNSVREEFEEWAMDRGWGIHKVNGFYEDPRTLDAWSAWLASANSSEARLKQVILWVEEAWKACPDDGLEWLTDLREKLKTLG